MSWFLIITSIFRELIKPLNDDNIKRSKKERKKRHTHPHVAGVTLQQEILQQKLLAATGNSVFFQCSVDVKTLFNTVKRVFGQYKAIILVFLFLSLYQLTHWGLSVRVRVNTALFTDTVSSSLSLSLSLFLPTGLHPSVFTLSSA